ncbi:MAG TPA: VWA domain-containing protein [Thermoanaerobaculia bacterium]
MRRPVLLLAVLLLALPTAGAQNLRVAILTPAPGQVIFGETEIAVQVSPAGARVEKVELYVDSVRVGVDESPPYRFVVDVGHENAEHHFEVVAQDASGATASAEVRTSRLQVDMAIDVRLQQLFVTIEGGRGARGLTRDDFTILDEGVPQQIVTFERGEVPFTAVLLLDASTSMKGGRLETALDGAKSFVRSMQRLDEVKLLLFSDHVRLETPFTSVPSILTLSLGQTAADGGSAVNDAVYLALKRLEDRLGRKVLILFSDGIDVESVLPMESVRQVLRRDPVVLYWLRLRREEERNGSSPDFSTAWRDAAGHRHEMGELRRAVLESGGRIETIDRVEQVASVLTSVLDELREQYVLGYTPSVHKGPGTWHDVELRVRGSLQARTQRGYVEK